MALPLNEQIAVEVLNTVTGVTVANGYNYDLVVERPLRMGNIRNHLKSVIYQSDPHELPDPQACLTKGWLQGYEIVVYIIPEETDTTPIDTYVNLIRSDIEKALMVDRYRGGLALDTEIRPPAYFSEVGGEYDALIVNIDVQYRTNELDPTIQA